MNICFSSLICRIGVAFLILFVGGSLVLAQATPAHSETHCDLIFAAALFIDTGDVYPMECIVDDVEPVPQSGTPLRQLLHTVSLLFPNPLNTALPGGLWFSLSGESDVEIYGIVRRRAGSAGSVPALRLREP